MNALVQIIEGRLYWSSCIKPPAGYYAFSIDKEIIYEELRNDFGPFDLGKIHRFCSDLKRLLETEEKPILYYSSTVSSKRSNSALLICAFQVITS